VRKTLPKNYISKLYLDGGNTPPKMKKEKEEKFSDSNGGLGASGNGSLRRKED
jgi:hypothetical protein